MKKISLFSIVVISLLITVASWAQGADKAHGIIQNVKKKVNGSGAIKANYIITLYSNKDVKQNTYQGKLLVKGTSYQVNMSEQYIYCNGTDVYTYLKNSNEVQISRYNGADPLSPAQLFNTNFEVNYDYKYISQARHDGKDVHVLELKPKKVNNRYTHMHLFVDNNHNIVGGKMFEKSGSYYYYTLSDLSYNAKSNPSDFTLNYKILPGVEVIDLR